MVSRAWFSVVFVCSTAVFDEVLGIKIDNQLKVITNDCYERLAIGHRLSSRDTYKTVKANTVPKCQKECTAEGDYCKAFSFGIGEKGNSTCELGKNFIKETATLQPIGTIENVDFDLYIKKLGCKLVIDPQASKPKPNFDKITLSTSSSTQNQYETQNEPKPTYLPENHINKPDAYPNEALNKPSEIPQKPNVQYGVSIPNVELVKPGSYGNQRPTSSYTKPEDNRPHTQGTQLIQGSLVSVSPGAQSYLHPVHDILIGENPYSYGKPKPGRPLGYLPVSGNGVHNSYDNDKNYDGPFGNQKYPSSIYQRPNDYEKYHVERPWGPEFIDNPKFLSPFDPYYDERPAQRPPDSYGHNPPLRPSSDSYSNDGPAISYPTKYRPSSNSYNDDKPPRPSDMHGRPPPNPYEDERPSYSYNKPQRPFNSYDSHEPTKPLIEKPFKPVHEKPEDDIPHRPYEDHIPPFRPHHLNNPYDDERPVLPSRPRPTGYDSRPSIIDDRIDSHYSRPPPRPEFLEHTRFEIPRPMGTFDEDRRPLRPLFDDRDGPRPFEHPYKRPEDDYRRPLRPEDDYRRPQRPEDDYRRPLRLEDEYRRPQRPEDDYRRPQRPEDDYRRPLRPEDDYRRPQRPEDDYRRPFKPNDGYRNDINRPDDERKPYEPHKKPEDDYRRPLRPEDDHRGPSGFDDDRVHRPTTNSNDKGYPRPDFHDRRPYDQRRPMRQPEDPNFAFRKPDYLFSANDRHDVVTNSTKYVGSNTDYTSKSNGTEYGNGTEVIASGNLLGEGGTDKNLSINNSIITESTGVGGEKITSIIIPLDHGEFSVFISE